MVSQALEQDFELGRPVLYELMERGPPRMPMTSRRWVGDMEEIAKTFEPVGLTPRILAGAADMYRFVGNTDLAERTPEEPGPTSTLAQLLPTLVSYLPDQSS